MENNRNSGPEFELAVIRKIMEDSRYTVEYNGIHFIFWGVLVTFCLIANYFMILDGTADKYSGMLWAILMPLGAVADFFIGWKVAEKNRVSTFAGRLLGSLWLASGIAMFMFGFLGPLSGAYKPVFISPVISTALGISYFASGSIQQLPWLRNLAFGWWAGAALMFLWPGKQTLLVFAVMMLFLQVVPGFIINRNRKRSPELKQA